LTISRFLAGIAGLPTRPHRSPVEQLAASIGGIAEGVHLASGEACTGADATSRVAGASSDARTTAVDVKALADALAAEAESLDGEVRRFLADVQAA
jgi:methyl-accepting chemotaxis protein